MNYKEKIYSQYISLHNEHIYGPSTRERLKTQFPIHDYFMAKLLPLHKDAQILDIGCGDGRLVFWLQEKGFEQAEGIDISPEQVEKGVSMGITSLVVADITEHLTHTKNQFDLIIAKDVFEHFKRQDFFDTLGLILASLKTGGRLLIQVPNGQGINFGSYFFSDITHEMAYTENSLRQLGLAAGFGKVKAYPVNPPPVGVGGIIRHILWSWKSFWTRFWKTVETGNNGGIFTANLIAVFDK
jgi:2-polyprenyl-3-methyl-5-hydroxy-6-metoxy-1,4-benzoquinol methylase